MKSILDEIRNCPPAPGHEAVLVPGQWERAHAEKLKNEGILLPEAIWERIKNLADHQGITNLPEIKELVTSV